MYLLDANVFIQASRLYYAPDIAPTFWDWLAHQHKQGRLASISRVRDELNDGTAGHLTEWANQLPKTFWLQPDAAAIPSLTAVAEWVTADERHYRRAAKDEFLRVADYFLVAQAHAGSHEVVTFEQPAPDAKKRVLIPDACVAMQVPYRNPFDVYRALNLRFK